MYARGRCAREYIILVSYAARRNQVSLYRACVKRGIGRADAAGVQRMKLCSVGNIPEFNPSNAVRPSVIAGLPYFRWRSDGVLLT